jgi:ABC-type antimicrobial peptide transport system permease subunit
MLNLDGEAHQIALQLHDVKIGRKKDHVFWSVYSSDQNEASSWAELLPQLAAALDMTSFSTLFVGLVLFAVVTLGIINTLFMSLYERMFEFGVMRAVGTRPFAMARLVTLEAAALGIVSLVLGIVLGWAVTYTFTQTGFDYSGIEFAGVTMQNVFYPIMELRQFILYPLVVLLFTTLVGLYPAVYAARMNAAEAMRRSF